uniref:Uncharacterized protein n=1 Tax=Hordeum vulgare subsp. vulgare TaxID=112509 RepID=A0A8I6X329_HORVV
MHLWSVEGAEDILGRKVRVDRLDSRTLERGHTKMFACWVWTDDVGNIPTKHCLGILPRGAGRVEEMIGFSPPDRRVAPPPATAEYSLLIHVDRVEDWTPPRPPVPPTPSRAVSHPLIRTATTPPSRLSRPRPGQWGPRTAKRGEERSDWHARRWPALAAGECLAAAESMTATGMVTRGGGENNAPGRTFFSAVAALRQSTHNLRLPDSAAALRRRDTGHGTPPAAAAVRGGPRSEDSTMLRGAVDGTAADVQAAADAVLAEPLVFDEGSLLEAAGEALQLDNFSPTLSDYGHFNRATPSSARTMEVQLGAVTSRVSQLELVEASGSRAPGLFHECRPPLLAAPPTRRSVPPPRSRVQAAPTRHNTRQAANTSTVPVAQRASLRLVKELGLLGPKEKMTEDVAKALIRRFDEPLLDSDIAVIAKLTRLDGEALSAMARMAGPDVVAEKVVV